MDDRFPPDTAAHLNTQTTPSDTPPVCFVIRAKGNASLIILREWENGLLSSGILTGEPGPGRAGRTALSGGRGSASVHTVDGLGEVVLRRYRRGGLIGKVLVDRYLSASRPFRELDVLALAHSRGVPVPEVIGASSIRAGAFWHRGRIVTRLIPGSRTLPVFISNNRNDGRIVTEVLRKAGRAIRKMHEAGIDHADLNMNNILVDTKRAAYVIDFDKATVCPDLGKSRRLRNLRRLLRSARKLAGMGLDFTDADFERILEGYCGTDGQLHENMRKSTTGSHRAALRGFLSRLVHRVFRTE